MSLHQPSLAGPDDRLPRIFGRYLLMERLSRGGMGELFLARHGLSGFEKLVVIKKVLPHLAADAEFLTRFIDEAQVAVQLQHANVAQVYEVGRAGDEYFLALEYVDGSDLRATMQALAEQGRTLPVELALFVAREAANGLAYAHRRTDAAGQPLSVVHCDISPPNLMLSFEGEVKIIDFGIARSAVRLTETNPDRGFGKFGYLAPEQLLKGGQLDQRTDIYALGVVLYEMLTGRRMFEAGENPDYRALARMVVKGKHPLPSDIQPSLRSCDPLVARALAVKPEDRYQSAADLRDDIQRALVDISPTINADHLAAVVREVCPGHEQRRRQLAELDKTDLEHWQRELDNQVSSTISFALRGGARAPALPHAQFDLGGAAAGEGAAGAARVVPALAAPAQAEVDDDDDDELATEPAQALTPPPDIATSPVRPMGLARPTGEGAAERADLGGGAAANHDVIPFARPGPARRAARVAKILVLLLLVGGSALAATAWYGMSRPASSSARSTAPPAVRVKPPAEPPRAAAALPAPVATPLITAAAEADAGVPEAGGQALAAETQTATPPPAAATESPAPPPASAHRADPHRAHRHRPHHRRPAPPLTAHKVQAHFRAAHREYEQFKKLYGARLESEWNDLAHLATFASGADQADHLAELDKKIAAFRGRMRALEAHRP